MKRELSPEEIAKLEKFGYDKLMDRLKELMKEQKERHEGGSRWIGTGGTSPFGNGGQNPEGRVGDGRQRRWVADPQQVKPGCLMPAFGFVARDSRRYRPLSAIASLTAFEL